MDDCIFCNIVEGKIPSVKIWEDDEFMAILDKFPATRGQTLIIPKEHEEYILNLDDEIYNRLFNVAKKISKAIDKSLNTLRTCFVVEGFAVPHVHLRLHPCYEKKLLLEGKEASNSELIGVSEKIKSAL